MSDTEADSAVDGFILRDRLSDDTSVLLLDTVREREIPVLGLVVSGEVCHSANVS